MRTKMKPMPGTLVRIAAGMMLVSLLAGCSFGQMPTAVPAENTQPTFEAIQTESAKTVIAQLTLTAPSATPPAPEGEQAPVEEAAATATTAPEQAATNTPIPTFTPVPPTPTNTYVAPTIAPTITNTPVTYACRIEEQSPAYGADFPRKADFDGNWKVKNTGSPTWEASQVDIKYIGGTKFQRDVDIIDLGADVAKDGTVRVIVDMVAPDQLGRFSTTWAIVQGGSTLCVMSLTIDVTE